VLAINLSCDYVSSSVCVAVVCVCVWFLKCCLNILDLLIKLTGTFDFDQE